MPLARFDPPASVGDLDTEALRTAWSKKIASLIKANKDLLQGSLGTNPAQFFNEITDVKNMADRVEQDIFWQGFPRLIDRQFGEGTTAAFQNAEDDTAAATARRAAQDEYLEWHVTRETGPSKRILSVEFTCEGPEYWAFLGASAPDKVLALYRQHIDPTVARADLFTPAGTYRPLNKWNTGGGAMHLIQTNNTLNAEVNIAAFATIKRKRPDGLTITDADELIRCSRFGAPGRASDPHIGDIVNGLARQGYSVTLRNPIGLYIASIDLAGFRKPDGSPVTQAYFDIRRGSAGQALRAVFRVPLGELSGGQAFTVSDIKIGGVKIAFGGQIARRIKMKLTGVAVEKGKIANPVFSCPGASMVMEMAPTAVAAKTAKRATRVKG